MNFSYIYSKNFNPISSEFIDESIPSLPTNTLSLIISEYTTFSTQETSLRKIIEEPAIKRAVFLFKSLLPESPTKHLFDIMENKGIDRRKTIYAIRYFNDTLGSLNGRIRLSNKDYFWSEPRIRSKAKRNKSDLKLSDVTEITFGVSQTLAQGQKK